MSQKKFEAINASEENLLKMHNILKTHHKHRCRLENTLARTYTRFDNATRDVLKRRFTFDIKQLTDSINDVKGKEAWTRRMIDAISLSLSTNEKGNLKHNPFGLLANMNL